MWLKTIDVIIGFFSKVKTIYTVIQDSDFFKTFKEEITAIPIILLLFWFINHLLIVAFPNGAFFDFFSQMETIVSKIVLFVVALWTAHMALRISFPKVYKYLHDEFYQNFDLLSSDKKLDYAVKFILVFILTAGLVFRGGGAENTEVRKDLLQCLNSQLNVREIAPNRSPEIDLYLKTVGSQVGNPWCGAFVGSNLYWCNIPNPNSAWSPDYAKQQDIIWTYTNSHSLKPMPGDVVTFYFSNLGRVGHVGFYESTDKDGYFITIEGNTGGGLLNREGDGVYKKKRSPYQIHAISRYLKY